MEDLCKCVFPDYGPAGPKHASV